MNKAYAISLILFGLAAASANAQISFQGRLADSDGQALPDGSYEVTVRFYDQPTGGSEQWAETQTVETVGGIFSTTLGEVSPLTDLSFDMPYYVALSIDGSDEIGSRTVLTAVPFAMHAQRLSEEGLEAGTNVTITKKDGGALQIDAAGGGPEGLTEVTSDATLSGDGTSGSPLSLADGSVTGVKIANDALSAGSNVTIDRKGNGSLEIASASAPAFTLPYSGTINTANDAIRIENSGSGVILHAVGGNPGVWVEQGTTGISIAGVQWGVIVTAQLDGINVVSSGQNGITIGNANGYGVEIGTTASHGVHIQNAGGDGIRVSNAVLGLRIEKSENIGVQIDQAGHNGIQIGTTVFDGVQIQNAGRDGIRVSNAGGWGLRVSGSAGAAMLNGNVTVNGTLSKSGGSFRIDHPLDPENRYLRHSFVESPDMMNVYNGNVALDSNGEATVELPAYFEALNRDFRYQLTAVGEPGPNLHVAEKIDGNRFGIAGGEPGMEVSWQVTGIRHDKWANENRIVVEENK